MCRDIDKRNLVSRFSSTGMSVLECIPASIFRWQTKGEYKTQALVAEIIEATKMWFSGRNDDHVFSPEDNDVAAWVLIATDSDPDHEYCQSSEQEEANVGRSWRLALLVNNMVVTGSIVDEGYIYSHNLTMKTIFFVPDGLWEVKSIMKFGILISFIRTDEMFFSWLTEILLAGLLLLLPHPLVKELLVDMMDKFTCGNYPQGRSWETYTPSKVIFSVYLVFPKDYLST